MAGEARSAPHAVTPNGLARMRLVRRRPGGSASSPRSARVEADDPDQPRIGRSVHAGEDPVRLGQEPSLAFAPATLAEPATGKDGGPLRDLRVLVLRPVRAERAAAPALSEYARDRLKNYGDPTLVRFARHLPPPAAVALLPGLGAGAADGEPGPAVGGPVRRLRRRRCSGSGMPALRNRDALPDVAKLFFAGASPPRRGTRRGSASMISAFFSMPSAPSRSSPASG